MSKKIEGAWLGTDWECRWRDGRTQMIFQDDQHFLCQSRFSGLPGVFPPHLQIFTCVFW